MSGRRHHLWVCATAVCLLAAVVPSLLVASPAPAATIKMSFGDGRTVGDVLRYVGQAVERNVVSISVAPMASDSAPTELVITDIGAVLTASEGCFSIDEHTARCVIRQDANGSYLTDLLARAEFDLGAGADQLKWSRVPRAQGSGTLVVRAHGGPGDDRLLTDDEYAPGESIYLFGGAGDDVLTGRGDQLYGGRGDDNVNAVGAVSEVALKGGSGNDRLTAQTSFTTIDGGSGHDLLEGGPERDELDGGPGHDVIRGESGDDFLDDGDRDGRFVAPSTDVLDGGPGIDTADYSHRVRPLMIDLAAPRPVNGETGEGDVLWEIENVWGGRAADRLFGNRKSNWLSGRGGHDTLAGRAGADVLEPDGGGGPIRCGGGRDTVRGAHNPPDYLEDCERLYPNFQQDIDGSFEPALYVKVQPTRHRSGWWSYKIMCPGLIYGFDLEEFERADRCGGTLRMREVTAPRRVVARVSVPMARTTSSASFRLTPIGERLATRARGVKVTAHLRFRARYIDAGIHIDESLRWATRVRAP